MPMLKIKEFIIKKEVIHLIPILLLFVASAFSSGISIFDDLWYHLLAGRYIDVFHQIPDTGFLVFNHTNTDMFYHSWLTQFFFYIIFMLGGIPALKILSVILAASVAVSLYYLHRKQGGFISFLVILPLCIFSAYIFLTLRPGIFSLLFFSLILLFQHDYKYKQNRVNSFLTVLVMGIWINIHGFWVYGVVLMLFFALDALIHKNKNQFSFILLSLFIVLCIAVIRFGGLNALYVLPQNGIKVIQNNFHEWYSPFKVLELFFNVDIGFKDALPIFLIRFVPPVLLTFLIFVVLFLRSKCFLKYMLGIFFGIMTLLSYRNLLFIIPIFIYIVGPYVENLLNNKQNLKKVMVTISIILSLILVPYFLSGYQSIKTNPLPLSTLIAKLPLKGSLIISDPGIADYILFLQNKDVWSGKNYVLNDIRGELYTSEELAKYEELLAGRIDNLPENIGSLNPIFILNKGIPLLYKLNEDPNYNIIAEEDGYYLVVPKELDYLSGN